MHVARPPLRPLVGLFLAACLASPAAADDPVLQARLERDLCSPLATVRAAALDRTIAAGDHGRDAARTWRTSPDARLRSAAWPVLAALGRASDLHAAIRALQDPDPRVALAAGRAVLALGGRVPPGVEPMLAAGSLSPRAVRPLGLALAEALEDAPRSSLPPAVTRLGEGLMDALALVLRHPGFSSVQRREALRGLAAMGGDTARRLLSAQAAHASDEEDWRFGEAWWRSVEAIGPGPGLEGATSVAVSVLRACDAPHDWRARRLLWRVGRYLYRFLGRSPPAEDRAEVGTILHGMIARAGDSARWRLAPSFAADIVRAFLVVGEPTDEGLRDCVLAAQSARGRGPARRKEELGYVLALLDPYRQRRGVREGATELLEEDDLPHTVRAWAQYLQGQTAPEALRVAARSLIDAEGAAATLAQRRLGAMLLERVGTPSVARIRSMRGDIDAWIRALALSWSASAVRAGRIGQEEFEAAVDAGLVDPESGVFLVASELRRAGLDPAQRERLLDLAVRGPRVLRGRAWQVVGACLGPPREGSVTRAPLPRGWSGLDARLRAAGAARAAWTR